jgi:hypothetical protein
MVTAAPKSSFVDVPAKHWSYVAVQELARLGIIDGYDDNTFRGEKTMTRYEMAQIVAKAMDNSAKATAVQKALIDKLAIEFALELNKLDKRVEKLEKAQPNIQFKGSYLVQYKIKEVSDAGAAAGAKSSVNGQYRLRLDGQAKVDNDTSLGFRFADPAPTKTRFRDSTATSFGDLGDNALKLDRIFATTKVGVVDITIGRQALVIDPASFIIDSGFFSYDGVKVSWKMGDVNADFRRGRFAKGVTDVYAFNGRPGSDYANIDVDAINLSGSKGDLKWTAGWANLFNDLSATSNGDKTLMTYYFVNMEYLFNKRFSMGAEVAKNQKAITGGQFWSLVGTYGDQSLNAKGKKNFSVQCTNVQQNAISTAYTGLDSVSEGVSDAYRTLDFNYRYAFSKNMAGKIQRTYIKDKDDDVQSYNFWKVQLAYNF